MKTGNKNCVGKKNELMRSRGGHIVKNGIAEVKEE